MSIWLVILPMKVPGPDRDQGRDSMSGMDSPRGTTLWDRLIRLETLYRAFPVNTLKLCSLEIHLSRMSISQRFIFGI
jgi:hypothetical protein